MRKYEIPDRPGYYVAHTAVDNGDPSGAVIFELDDEGVWTELSGAPVYGNIPEHYFTYYGWKMLRLVVEVSA